jgi:hypothetical protein
MRVIPTRVHGMLDYLMGAVLIIFPWLLDLESDAAIWVPVILGAGVIAYSLLTDYELGVLRRLPMSTHLILDMLSGIVLAASPWLFGFADEVWVPHVVLGILEIGAAMMTQTIPADEARGARRPA